jgi:glycosyltransferase involved in cell wall biosynthesis
MIVKNEAHCISKCLESIKPYINYWVICDTGSTDKTEEISKSILKDIPGEYHNNEWKDFSTNRNIALQLAKNKADYILIIDADDYLTTKGLHVFDNLNELAYNIDFKHGPISYNRTQLIHNSCDCKYIGVLHEYLQLPQNIKAAKLNNVIINYGGNGARSKDADKFAKDAVILEKAILDEPNNSRYIFYCAQSHRDAGNLKKCIEYYEKRASMGGWNEEVFVSLLEAAKAKEKLNLSIFEVESSYLKAYYQNTNRAEPLYYLSKYFRILNNFNKSYCYAKEGIKINKPNDGLFIEYACYDWKLYDELAISAYYTNNKNEGKIACEKILKLDIPEQDRLRIQKNYVFYNDPDTTVTCHVPDITP